MKFTCQQSLLAKALNVVSKAVSSRTTIPVLKGLLLKTEGETLYLTASDLDLSIETKIPVSAAEDGAVVVNARLFGDIVRKMPMEEMEISADGANNVAIRCRNSDFSIVGSDADEFPALGSFSEGEKISLDQRLFRDLIRRTSFAASIEESKGIIVGVLTELNKEGITMAALDGFRMAVCREAAEGEKEISIVIAARILNEIAKIIGEEGGEGDMELLLDEKKAVALLGETRMVLRLLEGDFIRYKDILPKEFSTDVVVDRQEFLSCIERASLLAREGKNNLIRLSVRDDAMTISSRSEEGNVKEEVFVEKSGDDLEIGFNSKYILDVLKVLPDESLRIGFNSPVSPCLIRPMEGNAFEYLVLPVRISGN
jgi:DNA polymerase-3 subunit beta